MTTIRYESVDDSFHIEVEGHAGYAELGNDIVCAAVSMSVQQLVEYLSTIDEPSISHIENGKVTIQGSGHMASIAAAVTMAGLDMLERNYPGYVRVCYE